ncbi:MAG TPA: AmmeMemoRadiSam system protein B [Deltaproteobacteria bacterium]|nr:AmmeMemoRadiSam system protein B [Deltaproteobacteria bacterium]
MPGPVRRPAIAGSWYPGDPETLIRDIDRYLSAVKDTAPVPRPLALIAPHAGYMYSGPVAAYAYRTVEGLSYETVVVISPSHRASFPGISVWPRGFYETPLGLIEVDETLCAALLSSPHIHDDTRPHGPEHALEIQLPFLQRVLGSFRLCPLIMGRQDRETCEGLAKALHANITTPLNTLVVASSDLSHFHSASRAENMDKRVVRHIESLDTAALSADLEQDACEACGGGPIVAAMDYARRKGAAHAKVLCYAHSGHVTGDTSSVVGYLAAVIS